MHEVLETILANRSVTTKQGTTRCLHSNISEEEGTFIQQIIRNHKPKTSIEIGCAFGIASLYICEALREVKAQKHIIIDPTQNDANDWDGIGLSNLERAGYSDIIDFHPLPSYQYLPHLAKTNTRVDFAFIDGMHTFDYVLVDLFLIDKILKPGGVVILDDFTWPAIRKVCRYALTNLSYRCIGPAASPATIWRRLARRVRYGGLTRLLSVPLRHMMSLPSDRKLGLPKDVNYVALQKKKDEFISDKPGATRSWSDHNRF